MPDAALVSAAPTDLVELGRVIAAYGVKGLVKVQPHSAQANVLLFASEWWLTRPVPALAQGVSAPAPMSYKVLQARTQGAMLVAQLAGVSDRDQAESLRGCGVHASRRLFPEPAQDEYYWVDLIGCAFYSNTDGESVRVGLVEEVLDNGAHAVLRVIRQQSASPDGVFQAVLDAKGRLEEMLVPFVSAYIHDVDLTERRIDSSWPLDF